MNINLDLIRLSEIVLKRIKRKEDPSFEIIQLANQQSNDLFALQDDNTKKAFWINIYNSYFLILSSNGNSRKEIFQLRELKIAGLNFTLDEIEHVILRKNKMKFSFGYLTNPFTNKGVRKFMLAKQDFRIHFALNCGLKGCPPIAFYTSENIDEQLETATASFLEMDSVIDAKHQVIYVSRLFYWYYADFGGKMGIQRLHSKHLKSDFSNYKIRYRAYDYTPSLDNFRDL